MKKLAIIGASYLQQPLIEKDEIENTDFDSLPDASDYIKKYDNHMSFTQTKGFGEVESLLKKLDA